MSDPDFAEVERRREMSEGVHPLGEEDPLLAVPDVGKRVLVRETEGERRFREVSRDWREHDRKEQG